MYTKIVIFLHILINAIFHVLFDMLIRCIDMRNVAPTMKILGIHCSLEENLDMNTDDFVALV